MTEGRLGEFVARKVNFEEFLQPWINAGYVVSDESMERLARIDALWDENGNPLPEKIQLIRADNNKITVVPRHDVAPEEYEKIAEELQKGQEAQQEAQALRQRNSELEQRLADAEQELKGTDEAIGGKKKALTQLEQELEQKGKELFAQKEDLKKEIAELEERQAQIKSDVSGLGSEKERLTAQLDTAKHSKKSLEKEIDALNTKAGPLKKEVDDAEQKLKELKDNYQQEEVRIQINLRDLRDSEDEIGQELDSKKNELETLGTALDDKNKELAALEEKTTEVKSLADLQKELKDREHVIHKMLDKVLPGCDASQKESVVAFYNAVDALFAKLDEVSAGVLASDIPEEPAVGSEHKSKVDIYIGLLDRMKSVYEEAKSAVPADSSRPVLDEKAEEVLDELLGIVYADLSDEQLADPAYVNVFVNEVRRYGFELYSRVASRNPEGLAYVLDELAKSRHSEGESAAAVALTERAIDLCGKDLPDDKEQLEHFEKQLKIYKETSK